jgi:hypothetical protein
MISRLFLRREYRRMRSGVDDLGREKKCGDYFYLNTPPEGVAGPAAPAPAAGPAEEEEEEEEEGRHHRGGASSLDLDKLFRSLLRGEQQIFANIR